MVRHLRAIALNRVGNASLEMTISMTVGVNSQRTAKIAYPQHLQTQEGRHSGALFLRLQ